MIDRPAALQSALFDEFPSANGREPRRKAAVGRTKPADFGLTAPSQVVKNYVLDTNVLLHDPGSLERFKENHLCIPVDVLAELDKFKSEQSERGASARRVHRRLTELFATAGKVTSGVGTPGGGTIRMVIYDPAMVPKN
ncbi:MAG: PIN domain-containing protein, partial [Akkermansiaceae bacterium]|nr:PIN domain-containing protein [Akkermansiaceae bacterium]